MSPSSGSASARPPGRVRPLPDMTGSPIMLARQANRTLTLPLFLLANVRLATASVENSPVTLQTNHQVRIDPRGQAHNQLQ